VRGGGSENEGDDPQVAVKPIQVRGRRRAISGIGLSAQTLVEYSIGARRLSSIDIRASRPAVLATGRPDRISEVRAPQMGGRRRLEGNADPIGQNQAARRHCRQSC